MTGVALVSMPSITKKVNNVYKSDHDIYILAAHQAENVALEENLFAKKDFLKKCGSNRLLAERQAAVGFEGIWKILYDFQAKPDPALPDSTFDRGVLEHKKAPEGRDSGLLFTNLRD